ncbi:MAG: hypothetical protein ACRD1V_17495 [Vicinamibacterales bacterium]
MPSAKELKGKYIGFRLDPGGVTTGLQSQIAQGDLLIAGQTTPASVRVYTAAGDAGPFTQTGIPWSFTFLKYVPGAVTTTPLTTAVMTGPMSGCFLFRYTDHNQSCIAHVGTAHDPQDPSTIAVKNAWKKFTASVSGVAGAAPFPGTVGGGDVNKAMGKGGIPQVVGYFAAGSAYAMILTPVGNPAIGPTMKVAEVKEMTLLPWANVANLKQFA